MIFFVAYFLPDIKLDIKLFRKLVERVCVSVDKFLNGNALFLRGLHILERIFVSPTQKLNILAFKSVITCNSVGLHKLQCVANMRLRIYIRNSIGNIKLGYPIILSE